MVSCAKFRVVLASSQYKIKLLPRDVKDLRDFLLTVYMGLLQLYIISKTAPRMFFRGVYILVASVICGKRRRYEFLLPVQKVPLVRKAGHDSHSAEVPK